MEGARVWYWTREELEVLVASGRVQLHPLPPAAAPASADAAAEPAEGGGGGGGVGGGVNAHDTTDLPTRALFTALLCPSTTSAAAAAAAAAEWTPEMDEALVRVANAAAAKRGLPAAPHVGRGELLAALRLQACCIVCVCMCVPVYLPVCPPPPPFPRVETSRVCIIMENSQHNNRRVAPSVAS